MNIQNASQENNKPFNKLVEYCIDRYEQIKKSEYRKEKLEEIKESRKAYEQKTDLTNFPWDNAYNVVLPLTTITVDNVEPRLVNGLVGQQPVLRFAKDAEQDQDDTTKLLENWYNQELMSVVMLEKFARSYVHDLLLEGTTYVMPKYNLDEEIVKDYVFVDDVSQDELNSYFAQGYIADQNSGMIYDLNGAPMVREFVQTTHEGGKFIKYDFTDIYVADNVDDWEKADIFRRVDYTYSDLVNLDGQTGYMNIGPWLLNEKAGFRIGPDDQTPAQEVANVALSGNEPIKCLECHIRYVYQGEDQEEKDITDWSSERLVVLIALDRRIILRMVRLRDLNFKNTHLIKRSRIFAESGRSYGTTVYGKMRSIQNGASDTFNLLMNSAYICMIPWFMYSSRAGVPSNVSIAPGEGIEVDDPTAVAFPRFNADPKSYYEFLSVWSLFWERLFSIGDLQIGRPAEQSGRKNTATEVMAVIQEGNVKHAYQSKTFRDDFIEVLKLMFDLYYQYGPPVMEIDYNGQKLPIPKKLLRRNVMFHLVGSTETANKYIERKQAEDLYALLLQSPIVNPATPMQDLLRSYGKTDYKRYISQTVLKVVQALQEIPQLEEPINAVIDQGIALAQEVENAGKGK